MGEVEAVDERKVPQGEAQGGGPQQGRAEPEVPLGEQEPLSAESDHGLSFIVECRTSQNSRKRNN